MKKLSIEQKAKAYDEAIEKMKEIITMDNNPTIPKEIGEHLFPELKESEDERVRKEIIDYVTLYKDSLAEEEYKSWIAWLEKQGEPTDINPSEFDLRLNKLLKQFEKLPKEELESSLTFYLNVVQNNGAYKEKQGEQKDFRKRYKKIAESEWFKKTYENMSLGIPCSDCVNVKGCINCVDGDMKETKAEQKPAIEMKSAEESLGISSDEYNKIVDECVYGEQKPAEWSSEDEIKLTTACVFLKNSNLKDVDEIRESTIKWLQSLKNRVVPQPKQEWSEEDSKMLESIEGDILNADMVIGGLETAKLKIDWLKSIKQRIGG